MYHQTWALSNYKNYSTLKKLLPLLIHDARVLGTHLFLPTSPRLTDCDFYQFLPLPHCFPAAFDRSLQDIYHLLSLLMTPLTTPVSPLLPVMSNHSECLRITGVILLPGYHYWDTMDWCCKVHLRQPEGWRAPSSEEKVSFKEVSLLSPALENKSVVLASTAIQLLDDRKSPIVAGKTHLSKIRCVLYNCLFIVPFVLSCRDPDEAGVLPKEVLDCMQTGWN